MALQEHIPNKLYFRIGEVSDLVGVKPYVLRYWETEFPDIRPSKSKSGQRLYKRRDVEMLLMVKELLYDQRFTIDGAKQKLRDQYRELHPSQAITAEAQLKLPMQARGNGHGNPTGDQRKVLQKLRVDLELMLRDLRN